MKNSSYQKLHKRISELEAEIETLITKPDSYEATLIKFRRQMSRKWHDLLHVSDRGHEKLREFGKYLTK